MDIIKNIINFFCQTLISNRLIDVLFYKFLPATKHYDILDSTSWNKKSIISLSVNCARTQ